MAGTSVNMHETYYPRNSGVTIIYNYAYGFPNSIIVIYLF